MAEISLDEALENAPADLRAGLLWFHDRRGTEIGWPAPSPVPELPFLVAAAKGIYKPANHDVALSVRQTLGGPYADRAPVKHGNGRWVYAYHQEGPDPAERDRASGNRGLMENLRRQVPVAVLIQTRANPGTRYHVQGLALVTRWDAGFFYLDGFGDDSTANTSGEQSEDVVLEATATDLIPDDPAAAPLDPEHDARVRALAAIVRRQGQGAFRRKLLDAYGGRCAITGCDVAEVLDAAHIQPYRGEHTNLTTNGLLLRSDVHALLDLGLLAVDPAARTVIVATRLHDTDYKQLHGRRLEEPTLPEDRPAEAALAAHKEWCGQRLTRVPAADQ